MIYQPPTQSQPPPQPRRPRWPRRHPVLTIFLGVFLAGIALLIALGAVLSSAANQITQPDQASPAAAPAASSAASTYTPPPVPAGPPVAAVGESMTVTQDGQDAATVTVLRVETSTQPVDQYSYGPAKGYFVSVLVRYRAKNTYTGGFDVSPLDWYAKTGSQHFDEGDANAYEGPHGMNGELDSPTLSAGETTTGWLLFDLPSAHGKIAYAPNYTGGALGYWRF
jgi:hypothetical protein